MCPAVPPYPMPRTIPQSSSHLSSFRFSLFKAYRFPYSAPFGAPGQHIFSLPFGRLKIFIIMLKLCKIFFTLKKSKVP